jgi:hypothetical protein
VVKIRGISSDDYQKIQKKYDELPNHQLKIDIDQIAEKKKTISCILKYTQTNIDQTFAYFNNPEDLLSNEQHKFINDRTNKDAKNLKFIMPINSKVFIFPIRDFTHFETISLEERKMPKLFDNIFYECTLKTTEYSKHTLKQFVKFCDAYKIHYRLQPQYKTQWLYSSYFGI